MYIRYFCSRKRVVTSASAILPTSSPGQTFRIITSLSFSSRARSAPPSVLAGVGVLKKGESRVRAETPLMMSGMLFQRKTRSETAQMHEIIAEMKYNVNHVLLTLYIGAMNSVHVPVVFAQSSSTAVKAFPSLPPTMLALRLARIGVLSTMARRSGKNAQREPVVSAYVAIERAQKDSWWMKEGSGEELLVIMCVRPCGSDNTCEYFAVFGAMNANVP